MFVLGPDTMRHLERDTRLMVNRPRQARILPPPPAPGRPSGYVHRGRSTDSPAANVASVGLFDHYRITATSSYVATCDALGVNSADVPRRRNEWYTCSQNRTYHIFYIQNTSLAVTEGLFSTACLFHPETKARQRDNTRCAITLHHRTRPRI